MANKMSQIGKELDEEWQVEIVAWPTHSQPVVVPEPVVEPAKVPHE